uniref:Uncharacterized protein n=1 Tax=Alexandrium monilatum TaxID=311494 RepID=A0A7S4QPU2_9DINO
MWYFTQALGLGMYYLLMTDHAQTAICVLGKSGRLLVVNRKPMISATQAGKMFRGAGITHIILVMTANTYFRAVERALEKAKESNDPTIKSKASHAEPLAQALNGNVAYFTLAVAVLLWLIYFVLMKTTLRPWGSADERNYYESKEACAGQYFRTGSRGIIPCLSRRRRHGGMRIFFGPYPERHIFDRLGSTDNTLKNLEPCLMLPTETDNGYPPSGSGQPADEQAAFALGALDYLNRILGTLGLIFFGIHIYNFFTNVQNCPIGSSVRDCVSGVDCTAVAKTPWLAHHLMMHRLRSEAELAADQLLPKVGVDTLGIWLNTVSNEQTEQKVLNISREACRKRYQELFVDPNATLYSATSDTIGKLNAGNYLSALQAHGYKVRFDESTYHCQDCTRSYFLYYFTNFDNLIEIIEVCMLLVTSYVSSRVYQLTTRKLTNCPMVDMTFASDPGSATELDIDGLERMCLSMIGHCFFYRYDFAGVPEHMEQLEQSLRQCKEDTTKLMDPWSFSSEAQSWNDYDLASTRNRRLMIVNRSLLGILEGEEVVSAWSETPMLTFGQKVAIFGGFIICFLVPLYYAVIGKSPVCVAEAFIMECIHAGLVKFYIFARRPQAGFILTSRRLFQVSRLPAYWDCFGKTEPMMKLDVLIHNSGLAYSSMTMEAYTPLWRRILGKVMRMPVFRRGQLIVEGEEGVFKLWRVLGDTRDLFNAMSKVTRMRQLTSLSPEMGAEFRRKEHAMRQSEQHLPDPACSSMCCPYTPPPVDMSNGPLLERYVSRKRGEVDVYGRKLVVRPASCGELCCGRGCVCEFSCCCCCRLDEVVTDFVVTTQRILVEQRTVQRYCRWYACCRSTPNIRTTYLAHHRAAAYLCQKDAQAFGIAKLKTDLNVKLLQKDAREYTSGLMLMQRPYAILQKQEMATFKDKIWVSHITSIYDIMTQEEEYAAYDNNDQVSRAGSEAGSWHSEHVEAGLQAAFSRPPEEESPQPDPALASGKRGKAGKGEGKTSINVKGKGKGRKGRDDGGDGKGAAAAGGDAEAAASWAAAAAAAPAAEAAGGGGWADEAGAAGAAAAGSAAAAAAATAGDAGWTGAADAAGSAASFAAGFAAQVAQGWAGADGGVDAGAESDGSFRG